MSVSEILINITKENDLNTIVCEPQIAIHSCLRMAYMATSVRDLAALGSYLVFDSIDPKKKSTGMASERSKNEVFSPLLTVGP